MHVICSKHIIGHQSLSSEIRRESTTGVFIRLVNALYVVVSVEVTYVYIRFINIMSRYATNRTSQGNPLRAQVL